MAHRVVVLKNSKNSILTLKTLLKTIDHHFDESYLWLNKLVKYQNKPNLIEEFYSVGIYDFQQLSYDELANEFGMRANNNAFIKYIKPIAIPT